MATYIVVAQVKARSLLLCADELKRGQEADTIKALAKAREFPLEIFGSEKSKHSYSRKDPSNSLENTHQLQGTSDILTFGDNSNVILREGGVARCKTFCYFVGARHVEAAISEAEFHVRHCRGDRFVENLNES